MAKVTLDQLNYLALEGGGGKGIAYLGVIRALEDLLKEENGWTESRPLFDLSVSPAERQLRGISGSSAGAITAFMLALGLSYDELVEEFDRIDYNAVVSGARMPISEFEKFFDDPSVDELRSIDDSGANRVSVKGKLDLQKENRKVLDALIKMYTAIIVAGVLPFVSKHPDNFNNIILRKLLFNKKLKSGSDTESSLSFQDILDNLKERVIGQEDYHFDNVPPLLDYLTGTIVSLGLFPGFGVREYFARTIKEKLINVHDSIGNDTDPFAITFSTFFAVTGVDLIVTGVNVSRQRPMYFSVYHTPNFPVVSAIEISMNMPLLFKPVYLNATVNQAATDEYNRKYHGLWVDGGMLTNYPLHAFDILDTFLPNADTEGLSMVTSSAQVGAGFGKAQSSVRNSVLGLRLTEGVGKAELRGDLSPKDYDFSRYLKELSYCFMYPSEEGQIRGDEDKERTIELFTEEISTTDFSNIRLDEQRNTTVKCAPGTASEELEPLSEMKLRVIAKAEEQVRNYFNA